MAIPLTTTTQLLDALRTRDDSGAWALLVERYDPVLRGVGRRLGLSEPDAEDAAQQALLELVRGLRDNQFDRARGGLRRWTLAILRHRIRDIQRLKRGRGGGPDDVRMDESGEAGLEDLWHEELQRQVLAVALQRLRSETHMADATLRAFELTAIRQVPVQAAALDCGMSCDEVYVARNRVLGRLRGIIAEVEEAMEDE
ncbi:MAG: sigma-70 family RNA polymerase sigma factor [Phycisphaerales bacterium]